MDFNPSHVPTNLGTLASADNKGNVDILLYNQSWDLSDPTNMGGQSQKIQVQLQGLTPSAQVKLTGYVISKTMSNAYYSFSTAGKVNPSKARLNPIGPTTLTVDSQGNLILPALNLDPFTVVLWQVTP